MSDSRPMAAVTETITFYAKKVTLFDVSDENDWVKVDEIVPGRHEYPSGVDRLLWSRGWKRTSEWFFDGDDYTAEVRKGETV